MSIVDFPKPPSNLPSGKKTGRAVKLSPSSTMKKTAGAVITRAPDSPARGVVAPQQAAPFKSVY